MQLENCQSPIMLVDDETEALSMLRDILECEGYEQVIAFERAAEACRYFDEHTVAAVIVDLRMPGMSGQELLAHIAQRQPRVPAIVVTAENQLDTAIDCMRCGVIDYIVKPVSIPRLLNAVSAALEVHQLDCRIQAPRPDAASSVSPVPSIITRNKTMLDQLHYVEIVSRSQQPVLLMGETGVGKELFARAVHTLSSRRGDFVSVNVAGLDDLMFSDALFGHRKGAYTGALSDRDGLVKKAAHGTLFLDEIGDLKEPSQIKLLRLIQQNEYYPLGSDHQVASSARVVLATNRNLKQMMNEGTFRKDLYYRLCTHQVVIPPLRHRPDDIPLILDHCLAESSREMGKSIPTYKKELLDLLCSYEFPGNIRELQAFVHDAVARCVTGKITLDQFRDILDRERPAATCSDCAPEAARFAMSFDRFPTMKEVETELIEKAMACANGNQGRAAQLLGITRQALNQRLQRKRQE